MPIMTAYNILPALSLAKILIKNKNAATEAHTATTMIISETMCLLSSKPIVKLLSRVSIITNAINVSTNKAKSKTLFFI